MIVATPRKMSSGCTETDTRTAELGAEALGLPLFEQGRNIARVLEARKPGPRDAVRFGTVVVQLPRRATKTTSTWATIIGRALTRPGYKCVVTAQSGAVASRILLEHAELLIRNGRCVESRDARDAGERIVLFRSGGRERLEFPNGSRIWVVPPEAGAVRSAAADDIVIDEAGEFDGDKGNDFLLGVLPLMDTRGPLAQLIISGTPGKSRDGVFWDHLEDGRNDADEDLGIVDYSASDDDDPEDEAVWLRVHPGPSSLLEDGYPLTPLETLRKRRRKLGPVGFAREYLCLWPMDSRTSAIDLEAWEAARARGLELHDGEVPPVPDSPGLAYDVAPDDSTAALAAAWRDDEGRAHLLVVDYRPGVAWLSRYGHALARKRRVPIRYDGIGANHGPARAIERLRGVETKGGAVRDAMAAAQLLVSELKAGTLVVYGQDSLDAAAEGATWRVSEGGRLFARKASAADVCALVAAALALYEYDTRTPVAKRTRVRVSGAA